jgi:hypothetical protein
MILDFCNSIIIEFHSFVIIELRFYSNRRFSWAVLRSFNSREIKIKLDKYLPEINLLNGFDNDSEDELLV